MKTCAQKELFSAPTAKPSPPIIIELSGLGNVKSFKTGKIAYGWIDPRKVRVMAHQGEVWLAKKSIRLMVRPLTKPEHKQWMERATSLIESQLRSALPIFAGKILTAASARSLIATLLPLDDCWTSFREVIVRSEKCEPGQEGATIKIERMD